ncbi:ABC transporter substrate-binding protein [Nonomuraea soli]|uniref:Peptide/nickel transport system substrate-binding protein n=1 Tax=Nonomuraea soli TaxID=1032476 RepID=A0A7W0HUJ2_9ACTN|nr:ABC transporter substrate-binding protein [Nonomuraea soli]MBA2896140.1 peptide/nickel transport system substrate-binding protein [Nonomuraea soli]
MRKTAAVAAFALLTAGCGSSPSAEQPATGTGTFTVALAADPGVLDPAMGVLSATNTALSVAYESLVTVGEDGKTAPGLAEKWEIKPDSVTFTLRKDITCSDGSKLTPADVADNVNHIVNPDTKSPIYGVLIPAGMKATSDATSVTLSTPEPFGFILQSAQNLLVVCGKGVKDRSLLAKSTYGTGPFALSEAVAGDHYTFSLRKDYSGSTDGLPGKVVVKIVPNEQTAANLMMSGAINNATFFGPDRARVEAIPGVTKEVIAPTNAQYFYHQGEGRPGADPEVRKALTQALNLPELAGIVSSNTGKPATGLVSEPRPCPGDTVTGHVTPTDPAAAASGLEAAGWKAGADGIRAKDGKKLSLRVLYATTRGPGFQAAAEYMAATWKKVGAEVTLNGVIDTKLAESLNVTQDWDVAWLPIGVTLPTQLVGFLSGPAAPKGANFAHLNNQRYTELVAQAAGTPGDAGCKLWSEAESALFDNHDLVPVSGLTILIASKGGTVRQVAGFYQPTTFRLTQGG